MIWLDNSEKRRRHVCTTPHRLVYIIKTEECPSEIRRDCITLLTSLAKGSHDNVISLCDYGACEAILSVLISSQNAQVIEAALRCARAIIASSSGAGVKHRRTIKNENFILNQFENEKIVSRLVEILELDSNSLKGKGDKKAMFRAQG